MSETAEDRELLRGRRGRVRPSPRHALSPLAEGLRAAQGMARARRAARGRRVRDRRGVRAARGARRGRPGQLALVLPRRGARGVGAASRDGAREGERGAPADAVDAGGALKRLASELAAVAAGAPRPRGPRSRRGGARCRGWRARARRPRRSRARSPASIAGWRRRSPRRCPRRSARSSTPRPRRMLAGAGARMDAVDAREDVAGAEAAAPPRAARPCRGCRCCDRQDRPGPTGSSASRSSPRPARGSPAPKTAWVSSRGRCRASSSRQMCIR